MFWALQIMSNKKNIRQTSASGFTLIELLVVITIIGELASIVLFSLANARQKAQTSTLREDVHAIQVQVDSSRLSADKPLIQYLSSYYDGLPGLLDHNNMDTSGYLSDLNAEWVTLGFRSSPLDPWGRPFIIQPKEWWSGPGDCANHDEVYSAGPNGVFESLYGISSGAPGVITKASDDSDSTGTHFPASDDDYIASLTFFNCPGQ
jgi:general secretion pathway protein G